MHINPEYPPTKWTSGLETLLAYASWPPHSKRTVSESSPHVLLLHSVVYAGLVCVVPVDLPWFPSAPFCVNALVYFPLIKLGLIHLTNHSKVCRFLFSTVHFKILVTFSSLRGLVIC